MVVELLGGKVGVLREWVRLDEEEGYFHNQGLVEFRRDEVIEWRVDALPPPIFQVDEVSDQCADDY